MKAPMLVPVLAVAFVLIGCSEPPGAPESSDNSSSFVTTPLFSGEAAIMTPISFVTTGNGKVCAITGYEEGFRPNGNSGRARLKFHLSFDITGDFVGSSCVFIDAKLQSPEGPQSFFTTKSYSLNEGCIPSRGVCGVWEVSSPGRIDPSEGGLANRNHGVMHGIFGDAVGTKIQIESFVECDPPGAGCATGVLLEPRG